MAGGGAIDPGRGSEGWAPTTPWGYGCAVGAGTWLFECLAITVVSLATGGDPGSTLWLLLVTSPVTIGTATFAGLGGVVLFRRWVSPQGGRRVP